MYFLLLTIDFRVYLRQGISMSRNAKLNNYSAVRSFFNHDRRLNGPVEFTQLSGGDQLGVGPTDLIPRGSSLDSPDAKKPADHPMTIGVNHRNDAYSIP